MMSIKFIKRNFFILTILSLTIISCSEEETLELDPFVVAFESLSKNLQEIDTSENISLVYSEMATENGAFTIDLSSLNAEYGVDFTTVPEAINNKITILIDNGAQNNFIQFKKLSNALDETAKIIFTISEINYTNSSIQGNSTFEINSKASLGGSVNPEVGGPNEGNQVYVDLSNESTTVVQRDSWDLGFYNGNEFRVTINGSIYMAVGAIDSYDIDAISSADVSSMQSQVAVGTFNPANAAYVDAPNGNILETAIAEISENDNENPVYLLNLGYEIGTDIPTVGSVDIADNHRGWKKIRILRSGNDYVLQYADLDDTNHQSITIQKNSEYNLKHFSFNTNSLVNVEPKKQKWDICFSVFTNLITGAGSYGFSDFVFHNRKGNAVAYQVNTSDFSYEEFSLSNVNQSSFSQNQTVIGSSWRSVFTGSVNTDRFYIIKDPNENIYKIKFLALTNSNGERGYPEFEYKLLEQ